MDFRKFKSLRLDLSTVFAYKVIFGDNHDYNHNIYLYYRDQIDGDNYFLIRFKKGQEDNEFKETVALLDDHFLVKTDEIDRLLP